MAVLSRCSRAVTAATTPNAAAAKFSYLIRALSPFSSSSSTFDADNGLNSRIKPAVLGTLKREPKDRNVQWVFLGVLALAKGRMLHGCRIFSVFLTSPPVILSGMSSLPLWSPFFSGPIFSVRDQKQVVKSINKWIYDKYIKEVAENVIELEPLKEIVNQGKLVSDEIIIDLLSKRLEAGEAKGELGFILDGFPPRQEILVLVKVVEILEGVTDIDLVINLKLREEALLAKCLGRRICSREWEPGMYMAPLPPPPQCASKLITRADDTEEVVKQRLRIYQAMTLPVEDFYRSRGKLLEFDLPGGVRESWPKLLHALNLEDEEDKQSAAA
ncbi:hypothetical protein CXB51_025520 [Gossypium anomalum]|uniref:adenylate kinase n=1 Tax=Gossypium anomalum TaxID=47600 RepID=A0A8J5YAD6_9ROSI|nr:hypothetical protein CXB51_025520 [Gossypium anomalum]